jgi:hypothetical protein
METSGARITAQDIAGLLSPDFPSADRILGLAEVMNYPGVLARDPAMLGKIAAAQGRIMDGHAPLVTGRRLNAYILAGPASDHECTRPDEAKEKLRKGMHIMIREGGTEQNLADLVPLVTPENAWRFSLVSDDRDPVDSRQRATWTSWCVGPSPWACRRSRPWPWPRRTPPGISGCTEGGPWPRDIGPTGPSGRPGAGRGLPGVAGRGRGPAR